MANANTKFGLRPARTASSRPYSGGSRVYAVPASDGTAIFLGDPVKLAGTGEIVNGMTYTDVIQAATGDKIVGVVISVLPDTRDSLIYRAASTLRLIEVCDDPDMLFEIQEASGGTAIPTNDVGLNANFVVSAGSTTTGQSGVELDNTTQATTNTLDLKIVEMVNRPDVAQGANCKWLVRINRHVYANQVAGT